MSTKKYSPTVRDPSSQFERDTKAIADKYNKTVILDGILLKNIALTATTTMVPHQLGRNYRGFKVVDKTGAGDVWRDASVTTQTQTAIALVASGNLTVSIWVF